MAAHRERSEILGGLRLEPDRGICAWSPGRADYDRPGVRRRWRSGRARCWESQVEGLLKAERHTLGVGPLQLLIAQVRTRLVEAVLTVARIEFLPRTARPVNKRLRDAVQRSCPVPVARIAGQAGQAKAGLGHD